MKQCEYCAKEISYHEMYCCDDCEQKANKYYANNQKFGKLFAIINTVCVFGIPVGIFVASLSEFVGTMVACVSCWILGLMLILLPFAVESMVKKFKIKKAALITRILGIGVIILGFLILGLRYIVFV